MDQSDNDISGNINESTVTIEPIIQRDTETESKSTTYSDVDIDTIEEQIQTNNFVLHVNEKDQQTIHSVETNIKKKLKKDNIQLNCNEFIDFVKNNYPKRLGYDDVEQAIRNTFYSKQEYYSSSFDVIASYVKGQKILYMESARFCTDKLNYLMLPTIFFSAIASVLSLAISQIPWGPILVSTINAINGFLLSVISYSKLDAASEAHKITSHQYDKLQSLCEFTSGCIMVLPNDKDDSVTEEARQKLEHIEKKIKDIKETNGFMIPEYVQTMFPNIFITNIFSKIKEFSNEVSIEINMLKNYLNELNELEFYKKIKDLCDEEEEAYDKCKDNIQDCIEKILRTQTKYNDIDNMFKIEIETAQGLKSSRNKLYALCCR